MFTARIICKELFSQSHYHFNSASRLIANAKCSVSKIQAVMQAHRQLGDGSCSVTMSLIQRSLASAAGFKPGMTFASSASAPASFAVMQSDMGSPKTGSMLPDSTSASTGIIGVCEEEDDEGVLPYIEQRVRKRGRLKRSDQEAFSTSPIFHMLNREDRLQRDILPAESKFLWHRAQSLAENNGLARVRLGSRGLTPEVLDEIGSKLHSKELVRVVVPPVSKLDVGFVQFILPDLLDCIIIKTRGNTVTIYRDGTLPPPRHSVEGEMTPVPSFMSSSLDPILIRDITNTPSPK